MISKLAAVTLLATLVTTGCGASAKEKELKAAREAGAEIVTVLLEEMLDSLEGKADVVGARALTTARVRAQSDPLRDLTREIGGLTAGGTQADKDAMFRELQNDPAYGDIFEPYRGKNASVMERTALVGAAGGRAAMALGVIDSVLDNTEITVGHLRHALWIQELLDEREAE